MKLESVGILVSLRPFGERDATARVFTRDFGVICAMMRAAQIAKKNKPLVGQYGAVSWNARLDSQLGVFHWDSEKNLAAPLMSLPASMIYMNSAFELIATLLPERESFQHLFDETLAMLGALGHDTDAYLRWELRLLRELGYALDLTKCAACGTQNNLGYISPRTGRAVCDACAAPYAGRLYKMPADLQTTRHFLDNACGQLGVCLPVARQILSRI